jgi:hypothetical protein
MIVPEGQEQTDNDRIEDNACKSETPCFLEREVIDFGEGAEEKEEKRDHEESSEPVEVSNLLVLSLNLVDSRPSILVSISKAEWNSDHEKEDKRDEDSKKPRVILNEDPIIAYLIKPIHRRRIVVEPPSKVLHCSSVQKFVIS